MGSCPFSMSDCMKAPDMLAHEIIDHPVAALLSFREASAAPPSDGSLADAFRGRSFC